MSTERLHAVRTVQATPAEVFAVLRDPRGHVDIDATGMLQDASGTPASAVGDRFTVHMDRESLGDYPELGRYDVEVEITAYEPDTEIAWTVHGQLKPPLGHVYGYRLDPTEDGGTAVTSYYDWSGAHPDWKPIFPVVSAAALAQTLGILDRTVRRRSARGDRDRRGV